MDYDIDPRLIMLTCAVIAFVITFLIVRALIPYLLGKKYYQPIHDDVSLHERKKMTPTMGGVGIVIGVLAASIGGIALVMVNAFSYPGSYVWDTYGSEAVFGVLTILLVTLLSFALGLNDDLRKITRRHNAGLRAYQKITAQVIIAAVYLVFHYAVLGKGGIVNIPFSGLSFDLGIFYPVYVIFIFMAVMNSVNLTDGMDGLCGSVTIFVALFFVFNLEFERLQGLIFLAPEIALAALVGALLGFLLFNRHPARIFMGDTGSLALGGLLSAAAIMAGMELYLPIVGIVYVIEAVSDILQVAYFKLTHGKRIFKMAPIHHHFELSGMRERNVVLLFDAVTAAVCVLSIWCIIVFS
jgi:phospho-N-acetylmuramoyl-pentapeptide-transferase